MKTRIISIVASLLFPPHPQLRQYDFRKNLLF